MTHNDEINDQLIADTVQSMRFNLPEELDRRVNAAMLAQKHSVPGPRKGWVSSFKWLPASAAALALIAAALFLFLPSDGGSLHKNNQPISEIKTELELAHGNIKIIWVQKKDFKLNRGANP